MSTILQVPEPELIAALENLKRDIFVNMNCVQIGIIESFDATKQLASVQIALKSVLEVKPDGTQILQERPVLLEVPVMILYGGGSYLTMPIAPGDNCLLVFNDREIDTWLYNGGLQTPLTGRAHSSADAIAIVGLRSLQNSIANYLTNGVRLAYNSTTKIDITSGQIDSTATLFKQHGNFEVTGNSVINGDEEVKGNGTIDGNLLVKGGLEVDGVSIGSGGGSFKMGAAIDLNGHGISGGIVNSSNGATGTYTNSVTVVNGIVTGGS